MQVRTSRLTGLAAVLAAGVLVAAPSMAGQDDSQRETPREPAVTQVSPEPTPRPQEAGTSSVAPRERRAQRLPPQSPDYPPGNPPSCLIPAGSPPEAPATPLPTQPQVECQPPLTCIRPAVDRDPGLTACSSRREQMSRLGTPGASR